MWTGAGCGRKSCTITPVIFAKILRNDNGRGGKGQETVFFCNILSSKVTLSIKDLYLCNWNY